MSNAALEIHCTQTAWASRAGLTVLGCKKRGNIFVNIYFGTYSMLITVTYISSCISA